MAQSSIIGIFKIIIIMQLFYAFSITTITHAMPESELEFISGFSDVAERIDLAGTSAQIQESVEKQSQMPIVELGALIFYSGNILLDLLLNFVFAIPQMIALIINGLGQLFNLDTAIFATVQLFGSVLVMVMYFIGIIQLLTGLRSGRIV